MFRGNGGRKLKVLFNRSAITKIQATVVAIIIIIALIIGVYYATLPGPTTTPPPAKRLLRVGMSWPNKIDPAIGNDECSTTSLCNLYDPLLWPKTMAEGGGVKPWVAESWTISENGLVYTFKIKKGIKFHSGRELTAEDVKFSLDRLLTIGQGFAYLFSPYVDKSEVLDTYTVQITLKKPFGPFLIACMRLLIIDKAEVLAHIVTPGPYGDFGDYATQWLITHDAGSGAYKVVDARVEEWYKYELFTDYWGYVDPLAPTEVIMMWTATGNPPTEMAMMMNKELEVTDAWLPEETLDLLDQAEGIKKISWPEMSEYYIYMNTKKPPLDDIHVRKAIAYICPYEEMMTQIYSRYTLATSCVPAGSPGYVNSQIYYTNKTLAEEELKKSKYYPDIINNPEKYVIEFHWIQDVPEREKDALLLAEAAAQIGLKIQPVKTPWSRVVEEMGGSETCAHMYDILVAAHYPEAGSLLETRYHSKSSGTWEQGEWLQNETIDHMIEDALATVDPVERYEKYAVIQYEIMKLCPSLFIYDYKATLAQQEYVVIPAAEDPTQATLVMGYERVYRLWKILSH
jgi:peptide/nickel transport system substrate-binding protein